MIKEPPHLWMWGAGLEDVKCNDTDCNAKGVIVPATGAYLVIDGKPLPVIRMWPERATTSDGRARWGVVTQEEPPADDNSTGGQPLAGNNTITDHYGEERR